MNFLTKQRVILIFLLMLFCASGILIVSAGVARAADCPGAAGGFVPLECFQDSAKLRDAYQTQELGPFMQKVFVGAISLGAILAVLRLAWAGFVYMSSDLWTTKERAREIIKDTFLGLFLLIAIYIILKQINPQILDLKINAQQQSQAPGGGTANPFNTNAGN